MATTMTQPTNQFLEPEGTISGSMNAYDDHGSTLERAGLRQTDLAARIDNQMKKKHKTKAQLVLNSNVSVYNLSSGSGSSNSLGTGQPQQVAQQPAQSQAQPQGNVPPSGYPNNTNNFNYSQPNGPYSAPSQNGSSGSLHQRYVHPMHAEHQYNQQQPQQQYNQYNSQQYNPALGPQYNHSQPHAHGPPRHFSQPQQVYRQQQQQQQRHSRTLRNSSVPQTLQQQQQQQQPTRWSPSYGMINSPGIRQSVSPTSPTRRVSIHSFIGIPETDDKFKRLDGEEDRNQNHNGTENDDARTISRLKMGSGELETLLAENEELKKKLEQFETTDELQKKFDDTKAKLTEAQGELNELREKNESYFYDIAKLRTDSSRRQQLNTQLVKFISDMLRKMPGYIQQRESFEELINSLSIPQSAKDSYRKAIDSYKKREASTTSSKGTPIPSSEGGGLLTEKDIFGIFREEVKLLNTKVSRLEEEKIRVEQVLQNRIDHERTTIRQITVHRNTSEPYLKKPERPSIRSRSMSSFRLIDVVEPQLQAAEDDID
ncbi:DEKNAAC100230 [Brettanomyces naardenensis]|uniref:DEKNAAC100230 n=1 Tax=Brettanomyces naardenensis TaxID=13370 RepID=A0A448YEW5_BRENA|nr:DEKNAAC100230 [Brettanomyces naardenensis]